MNETRVAGAVGDGRQMPRAELDRDQDVGGGASGAEGLLLHAGMAPSPAMMDSTLEFPAAARMAFDEAFQSINGHDDSNSDSVGNPGSGSCTSSCTSLVPYSYSVSSSSTVATTVLENPFADVKEIFEVKLLDRLLARNVEACRRHVEFYDSPVLMIDPEVAEARKSALIEHFLSQDPTHSNVRFPSSLTTLSSSGGVWSGASAALAQHHPNLEESDSDAEDSNTEKEAKEEGEREGRGREQWERNAEIGTVEWNGRAVRCGNRRFDPGNRVYPPHWLAASRPPKPLARGTTTSSVAASSPSSMNTELD